MFQNASIKAFLLRERVNYLSIIVIPSTKAERSFFCVLYKVFVFSFTGSIISASPIFLLIIQL